MYKGHEKILERTIRATLGLVLFSFGVYLMVQANIGLAPWDALSMGLSDHLPISFGTASVVISLLIVGIDLLMHEHIGLGTILDAVIVGECLNLFEWLQLIPKQTNLWIGVAMMIFGMFIMGFSQYLYMTASLCCGPRDAMIVGLGRRVRRVPIGYVSIAVLLVVLVIAALLGGPIGIGTLIASVCTGLIMQLVFQILHYEPRDTKHLGFGEMFARIRTRTEP